MKTYSPLRYPGGKAAMADLLSQLRSINDFGNLPMAEAFAGGAGASLSLLYLEDTPEIFINDKDYAVYSFWWSLVNESDEFLKRMATKRVSMSEYFRQRAIYRSAKPTSKLDLGFSTFFLNRCNRSGIIINGGPIGGAKQTGKWKIDARFNKDNLRERCLKVSEYRDRIRISNLDGIEFIEKSRSKPAFYFIDPPYYNKGGSLYLNLLDNNYHENLSLSLRTMADTPWVLTYDDCPEIRKFYKGWTKIKPFRLRYTAAERRKGNEIMIVPKTISLPKTQKSEAIIW